MNALTIPTDRLAAADALMRQALGITSSRARELAQLEIGSEHLTDQLADWTLADVRAAGRGARFDEMHEKLAHLGGHFALDAAVAVLGRDLISPGAFLCLTRFWAEHVGPVPA